MGIYRQNKHIRRTKSARASSSENKGDAHVKAQPQDTWKEIQIEQQAQTRKQSKKMQGDVSGQGIWRKEAYWETNEKKSK